MNLIIVTLVIIMTVGGHDYERHEPMKSIDECLEQAPQRTRALLSADMEGHEKVTQIGVGCVMDAGNPA